MADWRERDLRGDEGPAGSVTSVVRHARFGLAAARLGEAVLFGAAALCLTLAAAVWNGAGLSRADAWLLAVASAACAAGSWWLEHRRSSDEVARTLDRRLRHQGALVTAYELESRDDAPRGELARLLVAQVLTRLRKREAVHALRPGLALPVAAPLVGAALLAFALEARRVEPPPNRLASVAGGLVGSVEGALHGVMTDEDVDLEFVRGLRAAVGDARDLEREIAAQEAAETGDAAAAAEQLTRLAEVDRKLVDLAREARDPELRAEISEARTWLDALRDGLEREYGGDAPRDPIEPGAGDGPPETPEPAEAPEAPEAPESTGGGDGAGLAGGGGEPGDSATSTGPGAGGELAPGAAVPPGGVDGAGGDAREPLELGAGAGAWWPERHDEVVRSWLERVRAGG